MLTHLCSFENFFSSYSHSFFRCHYLLKNNLNILIMIGKKLIVMNRVGVSFFPKKLINQSLLHQRLLKTPYNLYSTNQVTPKISPIVNTVSFEQLEKEASYNMPETLDLQITLAEEELLKAKKIILKKKQTPQNIIIIQKKHSIWDSVKHMMQLIGKSMKDIYIDTKYIVKLRAKKKLIRNYSLTEYMKYRRIVYDLFKFIPYSAFLIIPFLELLLPVYMVLFPNSLPSQFFTEKTIGQVNQKFQKAQQEGLSLLEQKLIKVLGDDFIVMQTINKTLNINSDDVKLRMKLRVLDEMLTQKLLDNWDQFAPQLEYKNLNLREKEACLKLFQTEYINGRNMANLFYNFPKMVYKIVYKLMYAQVADVKYTDLQLHFTPFKQLQQVLLKIQLQHHLKRLKYENKLLDTNLSEQIKNLNSQETFNVVRKRGFSLITEQENKDFMEKQWPKLMEKTSTTSDKFIWLVAMKHKYVQHLI